jgi:error-prone DNA polymerase
MTNNEFRIESIPLEDDEPYRAMRSGELIGIPQSASPAMRQAHIRVRTSNLHDASLVQAGIRPGVGGAVKINELIARRRGKAFTFEHPDLEEILGLTYGILVFQEQVDQLLQKFAGYSSGEAEETRENIHKYRREDFGESVKDGILQRIRANGYDDAVAEAVYRYVSEFKGYGFAQGHALAFAEISIRCIACQQNYPAAYFASLLDAQPAGYYGPCTLVNEARDRGIVILPPSLNSSTLRFEVEDVLSAMDPKIRMPDGGIRVSIKQISGVSSNTKDRILTHRADHFFTNFFDFVRRVEPDRDELERLILCGCFDELHPNRRSLLWAIPSAMTWLASMSGNSLELTFDEPSLDESIEDFSVQEKAMYEREILDLDVHRHLMAFERERIHSKGGIGSKSIRAMPGGQKCMVVGNPIRLRFPPTPSGKRVVFFDLEDEFGLLNITCFDAVYRKDGHAIVCSPYVTLLGETQDRDGHTAFLAKRVFTYRPTLSGHVSEPTAIPVVTGDFLFGGGKQGGLLRNAK